MSEENVELVRRIYEATNNGDIDAVVLDFHPEIEFHAYPRSPEGVYHGKQAAQEYIENVWERFESVRIEVDELLDAGDQVVVVTTQHPVPKRGQEEMTVHLAEVYAIRDGLLAERRPYSTRNEALEAAGLSE
jgi:ketosteroid isomerase-like protein